MIEAIIRALDLVIRTLELAVNAIYVGLDALIRAIEQMSRRMVGLLVTAAQLFYYLFPFFGLLLASKWEGIDWLFWVVSVLLMFFAALFLRELLGQFRGVTPTAAAVDGAQRQKVFLAILAINCLVVGYFIFKNQLELTHFLQGLFSGGYAPQRRY